MLGLYVKLSVRAIPEKNVGAHFTCKWKAHPISTVHKEHYYCIYITINYHQSRIYMIYFFILYDPYVFIILSHTITWMKVMSDHSFKFLANQSSLIAEGNLATMH